MVESAKETNEMGTGVVVAGGKDNDVSSSSQATMMKTSGNPAVSIVSSMTDARTSVSSSKESTSGSNNLRERFDTEIQPLPPTTGGGRHLADGVSDDKFRNIPGAHAIIRPRFLGGSYSHEQSFTSTTANDGDPAQFSAELVEEDDPRPEEEEEEVIEGKTTTTNDNEAQTRRGGWVIITLVILVLGSVMLTTIIPLVNRSNDGSSSSCSSLRGCPTRALPPREKSHFAYYPPFQGNLSSAILQAIEEDPDSPFYKANVWMQRDPALDAYSPERQRQRFYLAMFYHATNGDFWLNNDHWLSYDVSECEWYSKSTFPVGSPYYPKQACDDDNDSTRLSSLSLASNNLTGVFPMWFSSLLPKLRIFDVGHNHIGGPLPTLFPTPEIQVVILSQNPLTGIASINAGGKFENLKVSQTDGTLFRANNNGAFYLVAPNLEVFNYSDTDHDGIIYTEVGLLPHLTHYALGHTEVHGTIPSEIGLATNLQEIDFSSLPLLEGTIPSKLGLLTNLTLLDMSETPGLSGSFPVAVCERQQRGLLVLANCSAQLKCCA